jgi:predicted O-methyltransferase YrrM
VSGVPTRIARGLERRARALFVSVYRAESHGDRIRRVLAGAALPAKPVFVETGCGLSTLALAELGEGLDASVHSFDSSEDKVAALRERAGRSLERVRFWIGDSLDGLRELCGGCARVDFAFLDSAPSALHTFREFQILEPRLQPGARVLIDNAALPGAWLRLSPCRKGAILVPYLLASPFWEVAAHPRSGDSMVSAIRHATPDHADPRYEDLDYVDHWRRTFERGLPR